AATSRASSVETRRLRSLRRSKSFAEALKKCFAHSTEPPQTSSLPGGGTSLPPGRLHDPAAANHLVPVVEHRRLPWRYRALRLIECGNRFIHACGFKRGPRRLVTMTDLGANAHRAGEAGNADPVEPVRSQMTRGQLRIRAHRYAMIFGIDLQNVERIARSHLKALALAHSEVEDALMPTEDIAIGCYQFAGCLGRPLVLLLKIRG